MTYMPRDGWHVCEGYPVWVEDGRITRGVTKDGQRPVHPYRAVRGRRGQTGWEKVDGVAMATLRSGLRRGNWRMM